MSDAQAAPSHEEVINFAKRLGWYVDYETSGLCVLHAPDGSWADSAMDEKYVWEWLVELFNGGNRGYE